MTVSTADRLRRKIQSIEGSTLLDCTQNILCRLYFLVKSFKSPIEFKLLTHGDEKKIQDFEGK